MTISLATAIARVTASKPVRLAVEAGLFCPGATYFDYGCGHGADIDYLHRLGFTSGGWDPHFRPDQPQLPADVVNIGYVINVIEDTAERSRSPDEDNLCNSTNQIGAFRCSGLVRLRCCCRIIKFIENKNHLANKISGLFQ